ncbi:hypothetical protein MRX96_036974 [Rhipicephalus microplus]
MTEAEAFDAPTEDPPPGHDTLDNVTALLNNVTNAVVTEEVMGPRYHKRVRIGIIITMIILSVVGNTVVCCNLLVKQRRRRVSKARVLFLNLAVADLLVACITMASQVVWEVMGRLWIAGDAFCRFFKFLQTFALVSSTYMLVAIAIDSVEVAPGKCFCASIFYDRDTPLYHRQIYMGFVFFTVFVVPLVLLIAFHAGILWAIWKHSATNRNMSRQTTSSLPQAKVKTLKITAVVFGAFLVTNVPYMVQEAILAFGNPGILDANMVALFGVISASNSAINPYIFLYFQRPPREVDDDAGFWRTVARFILESLTCRLLTRSRAGSQMSTEDASPSMRQSKVSIRRNGKPTATDTPPNMKSRSMC